MFRSVLLVLLLGLVSCGTGSKLALQGESIQAGGDSTAVADTIELPDLPAVFLSAESGEVGIGVFQARTGVPYVTLLDRDRDGVFDLLTYNVLSPSGEVLIEVVDYGMDGQLDFRWKRQESSASVFYRGAWHEVIGVGTGNTSVTIDGKIISLEDLLKELDRDAF